MTTMDGFNNIVHSFVRTVRSVADWKRLSSVQKLLGLTLFASIVAVLMERWGVLFIVIVTMVGFAYLTDKALTVGWLGSSDPLAYFLEKLENCRELASSVYCRILNTNRVTGTHELRKRSESIASAPIPDLDIEVDSGATGSTFKKKIRLELNSIILLIIRDFVQFWYNKFSYNSQFLKDARHFLSRGFYNIVERMSRLGPHKTSAKVIHAYRKHLSSFQMAQSTYLKEKNQNWPQKNQTDTRTTLKRLESVDEVFQMKFQFHPAVKSREAEKQYLRSLTKVILLCSCSRDVVSAVSAQIFFIEILSVNVLLPVVEMLSTSDRIYEILIKLTYNDDGIMDEQTMRELIDVEVKRMQLKNGLREIAAGPAMVTEEDHESKDTECSDEIETNQASGNNAAQVSGGDNESSHTQLPAKSSEAVTVSQVVRRKSKPCGNTLDLVQPSSKSQKPMIKAASMGNLRLEKNMSDCGTAGDLFSSVKCEAKDTGIQGMGHNEDATGKERKNSGPVLKRDCELVDAKSAANTLSVQGHGDQSVSVVSSSNESIQDNHVYGEILSTNIPLPVVKHKLQAFKDLFRSKKSKQLEESKSQGGVDKDQGVDGHKNQPDTNGTTSSENNLLSQRFKSLRLSPLLSRSGKANSEISTVNGSSAANQSGNDGKSVADTGSDKQTPSPAPTPSPSQPSKGGPLSFFRFRKPNLEFRKSSLSAVEDKLKDGAHSRTSSTLSEDSDTSVASASAIVPSVHVTDESEDACPKRSSVSDPFVDSACLEHSLSISSYDEASLPNSATLAKEDAGSKQRLFIHPSDKVEEGEEAEVLGVGDGDDECVVGAPPDSSLIFQDISIPSTMTCQEFRSNSQFTVYHIEYEALHFSETGIPVMKTGTAKRRYREFVNLMSRLEDNPAYKRLLKDVKGPKRWLTLPFKNMDKDSVASRQKALEQFLKSLIEVEAVCNGPEMREFLAYEGDSHIAFVKKATEISVPRIDKMLARTVSGVFDKLKSLPSLPQEVISGIRGRDTLFERKESTETDTDSISVVTDFSQDTPFDNVLPEISENYVCDIQTQGHPDPTPSSPTSQLLKEAGSNLYSQILLHVPRVEGDGAEHPDEALEEGGTLGMGLPGSGQLLLCDAVLDLVVQVLGGQQHWLCHQRVLSAVRNVLGRTMDRWLKDTVSSLTTEERCLYYIRLLRETVWPGGKFFSSQEGEKTEEELLATRTVAKRLLLDFFPGAIAGVMGADSMEDGIEVIMESLQHSQLNKHFLYTTIDMLLESLFPEIADPEFQNRLLS